MECPLNKYEIDFDYENNNCVGSVVKVIVAKSRKDAIAKLEELGYETARIAKCRIIL